MAIKMKILSAVTASLLLIANTLCHAQADSLSDYPMAAIPGGIVSVPLGITSHERPTVTLGKQPVLTVQETSGEWVAVVGVPLEQNGKLTLTSQQKQWTVEVGTHDYPEQHITVENKRHVNPETNDMTRINKEYALMGPAYKGYNGIVAEGWQKMSWPVKGPLSSPFGFKRFFNEQPRKPHSGLDIAAPAGTTILAPADGKIVLTGEFFFNGNSVFIDHGQGLISMMCHMSRIDVKDGQIIKRGDAIGAVGQTGRATGPHLHWSISMNNTRVNPLLLVADPNGNQ
tara:strand:+ start:981 stop:1835 length:855 start_codon:yes stop_codon:yes gene_type:complete